MKKNKLDCLECVFASGYAVAVYLVLAGIIAAIALHLLADCSAQQL